MVPRAACGAEKGLFYFHHRSLLATTWGRKKKKKKQGQTPRLVSPASAQGQRSTCERTAFYM